MEYFTLRNMTILGLLQVGVIVIAILAAGVTQKWYTTANAVGLPQVTALTADYGHFVLAVPVVWIVVALIVLMREDKEEDNSPFVFFLGILVLLALLVGVLYTSVGPFLRLVAGGGGLSS